MNSKLKIGLFGFGCVGSGLYEVLNQSDLLRAEIKRIVVKDPKKTRSISADNFSFNKEDILNDPEINLVVELIDDAVAAKEIVTRAIKSGKHVVSANKKLIAENLEELLALSKENNVSFLYEAAVCASIPIIRNLEEYYNNDALRSIEGICNGTTNYILTRLDREKASFEEILSDAQRIGFAETDPTLDIDGFDSKYKLQLLILHAFGLVTTPDQVLNIGIRNIKEKDIQFAKEKGYRVKLVSSAIKSGDKIKAFVAPQFVSPQGFGYDVNYEFNAVCTEALFSDQQLFKGKGAGSFPTASAVLSDISALLYDYKYEYRKKKNTLGIATNVKVKAFISSSKLESLEKLKFDAVYEEFKSVDYSYRVGILNIDQLDHSLYRENPELFISFYESSEWANEEKVQLEKELELA